MTGFLHPKDFSTIRPSAKTHARAANRERSHEEKKHISNLIPRQEQDAFIQTKHTWRFIHAYIKNIWMLILTLC